MASRSRAITTMVAVVSAVCVLSSRPVADARPASAGSLPPGAVSSIGTLATSATSEYQDWNWANPDPVFEYVTPGDELGVVEYDSNAHDLTVDVRNPSSLRSDGATRTIDLSGWPDWGGFYAGADGHFYVLVGRENPNEDDDRTVVAVRRYDPSWNLVGTAYVRGGTSQGVKGIYSPFDAGHPHMTLVGDRLVVHMSRLIYAIDDVHHQVNLTFEVDTGTMTATSFADLGDYSYSSHSFQQLVAMNGSDLVVIDHGDAYPRAIQMGVMANYPTDRDVRTYDLFDFNGAEGDNVTGASVTGLVSGPQGVVVLGDSIPQPDAPNGELGKLDDQRNVFAISADPATGEHTVHWLTDFAPKSKDVGLEPRVVQVGADEFAVLFGVETGSATRLEYRLIDSAGNVLASKSFPDVFYASISDPVDLDGTVYWVSDRANAAAPAPAFLFALDVSDVDDPALVAPTPQPLTATPSPVVTGTPRVGSLLRARPGTWGPAPVDLRYQWFAGGRAVAGQSASSFRPSAAQYEKKITVRVTGAKSGYITHSESSTPTGPVAAGSLVTSNPTVTGSPRIGHAMRAVVEPWGPGRVTLTYQWSAAGRLISGAHGRGFRPTAAQRGRRIAVRVTGNKKGYRSVTRVSRVSAPVTT